VVADHVVPVEIEGVIVPTAFEGLAAELAAVGFNATSRTGAEERDLDQPAWEILLWLPGDVEPDSAVLLMETVVAWVRKWLRQRARRPARVTVKIHGPTGRVLRQVHVDEEGA
jgi:hypothetical protein